MGMWMAAALMFAQPCPAAEPWHVRDAPYRVKLEPERAPDTPEVGWRITLPEFGASRSDLKDMVLIAPDGREIALAPIHRQPGQYVHLLAEAWPENQALYLYFGKNARRIGTWKSQPSLLLETRRRPDNTDTSTYRGFQEAWSKATVIDGMGFVPRIYSGENPFGPSSGFLSHFRGFLRIPNSGEHMFYTISDHQSYVFINRKPVVQWTANKAASRAQESLSTGKIRLVKGLVQVDYYHAMGDGAHPGMVMGWKNQGTWETIPDSAWVQSGSSKVGPIERVDGGPVPLASVQAIAYLGYADQWFIEAKASLAQAAEVPETTQIEWLWPDGFSQSGREVSRLIFGQNPRSVTVRMKHNTQGIEGQRVLLIPRELPADSIHNGEQLAKFLRLLEAEIPEQCTEADRKAGFLLARDFAPAQSAARWAAAWLALAKPAEGAWVDAQTRQLRWQARTDPAAALKSLRALPEAARSTLGAQFFRLEMDFLVFALRSPECVTICNQTFRDPANPLARIRLGDYYRLTGDLNAARDAYAAAADRSPEVLRKGPTLDRAAALAIDSLLGSNHLSEARQRLESWEMQRPEAKFESDFLFWQARIQAHDGLWLDAVNTLQSSLKVRPSSPEELDVLLWLGRAHFECQHPEEARKIWDDLTRNHPKHESAHSARQWLEKLPPAP